MDRSLSRTFVLVLLMAGFGAALSAFAGRHAAVVAVILVLALAKGRLVVLDFMEMRGRSGVMPAALFGWCGLLLALAFARFLFAG